MTVLLDAYRQSELSLNELTEAAKVLLTDAGPGPSDDRVTTFPDGRTVRYYQSLGITDRPLGYEGRQAIYGYRHLLQVVVVKLLQARGLSLAQIQDALRGAPTEQLEAAVLDVIGAHSSNSSVNEAPARPGPTLKPDPPLKTRTLVEATVAPGITITLDPALVADTQAVLTRLAQAVADLNLESE